jgi:hypothetical protein
LLESTREISAAESAADALEEKEPIVMDKELEAALSALIEGVNKLVERADNEDKAKADLAEAERKAAEEAKAPTAADIAGKLVEAELPKAAQARVLALVESGKDLDEAITAEKEYLKEVSEAAGKNFVGDGSEELKESATPTVGARIFR